MFWKKAHATYDGIDGSDADLIRYFEIMAEFQSSGYGGVVGLIQDMGHRYVSKFTEGGKVLEIGFGLGRQGLFFKGAPDNYYPTDVNPKYVNSKQWSKFKNARLADATQLPYEDSFFDTVVSVYNLEHIRNIQAVLEEIKRVLKPNGKLIVALPCEDGLAWNIGRELTTRRHFMKHYQLIYDKVTAFEHVHNIKFLLKKLMENLGPPVTKRYYPFLINSINLNAIYCGVFINNSQ